MVKLGPEISEQILSTCRTGSAEAAAALGRAWGGEFTLTSEDRVETLASTAVPASWQGGGLICTATVGEAGVAFVVPSAPSLLPAWCEQPDESGKTRLAVLAQELAMNLLPETFSCEGYAAQWFDNLGAALRDRALAAEMCKISLAISNGSQTGEFSLVWPLVKPAPAVERSSIPASAVGAESPPTAAARTEQNGIVYERIEDALPYLPVYSRSLLKIKVPVRVTLAATRLPVRKIIELAPGALIQFAKSCDEALDLEVGQHAVARGEAVKVGEKFGLRITAIVLPGERFGAIAPHTRRTG